MSKWLNLMAGIIALNFIGCGDAPPAIEPEAGGAEDDYTEAGSVFLGPNRRMYKAPVVNGTVLWRYPDGNRRAARTYANGFLHGPATIWFEDGKSIRFKGTYNNNRLDGPVTVYYKTEAGAEPQPYSEINWTQGRKNGTETWWHPNGKQWYVLEWQNGRNVKKTAFDKDGNPIPFPEPRKRRPLTQSGKAVKGGSSTNASPVQPK